MISTLSEFDVGRPGIQYIHFFPHFVSDQLEALGLLEECQNGITEVVFCVDVTKNLWKSFLVFVSGGCTRTLL